MKPFSLVIIMNKNTMVKSTQCIISNNKCQQIMPNEFENTSFPHKHELHKALKTLGCVMVTVHKHFPWVHPSVIVLANFLNENLSHSISEMLIKQNKLRPQVFRKLQSNHVCPLGIFNSNKMRFFSVIETLVISLISDNLKSAITFAPIHAFYKICYWHMLISWNHKNRFCKEIFFDYFKNNNQEIILFSLIWVSVRFTGVKIVNIYRYW